MTNDDSIKLLRECNSGIQMAVYSIEEVLDNIKSAKLIDILNTSKNAHQKLGDETHALLSKYNNSLKEPNTMAKSMSWLKTNVKLMIDESDKVVADLITDGCNMGIKSLYRYRNQYKTADEASKKLCEQLIREEENLRHELRDYL